MDTDCFRIGMTRSEKKIVFGALFLCAPLLFMACNDPMFPKIRWEVPLESATIRGTVNSLVRFNDNLYTQNGAIYTKGKDASHHGAWQRLSAPDSALSYDPYSGTYSGLYITKLAADNTKLYALGTRFENKSGETEPSEIVLYFSTDTATWDHLYTWSYDKNNTVNIFCTNAAEATHRKAYVRVGSSVYELSMVTENNLGSTVSGILGDSPSSSTNAAVYFSSNYYLFDTTAAGTSSSRIYRAAGSTLKSSTDGSVWDECDAGGEVVSLAVNSDSVIVGSNGRGLVRISLKSDGSLDGRTASFATNADSALNTPYRIPLLFSLDPTKTETANTLYASATFRGTESTSTGNGDDVCLWSYYPDRGNWNRE
ncbi:MAG: hypothetical protein IJ191_05890 [Treponema sp.]|nr:hypothetical protein [Treponema sp.]